uniref:Uncharacterized protein n=1 Tax=Polytomella parva TaxID=51329 RepID=A0A7S0V624_9CHLO
MKLTAVGIFKYVDENTTPITLGMAMDLNNFGYFQRGPIREGLMFLSRTIVQRTVPSQRQTVKNDEYFCHVYVMSNNLAGIVVADKDYPNTAAFAVIDKILTDVQQKFGTSVVLSQQSDSTIANQMLEDAISLYQDHLQVDKISKIQKDLDDTKVLLHETIHSVLKRGEKLDALVDKSNDLSLASQMFYKQAKKTNSCCTFM